MTRADDIEELLLEIIGDDSRRNELAGKMQGLKPGDWQALLECSIEDGLFPPLYIELSGLNLEKMPSGFLPKLKNQYLRNLKRNLVLEQELFKIISYLKQNGISAIPLKGPVLARLLYNDLAARRASCDLDLLVRPEQFNQAKEALQRDGYRASDPPSNVNFKMKYARQLGFLRRVEGVGSFLVDLHFDLRGLFAFSSVENFWRDLQEFNFDENKVLLPANENLLVYLALISMSITEFIELRRLYDIYAFVIQFNNVLDWDGIAERLDRRHKAPLFFALTLAGKFFKFDLPESFLKKIKPNLAKRLFLSSWINKRNVLNRKPDGGPGWYYFFTLWHYFITSCLYSENIFDCVRIIYRKIFLPKVDLAACYGKRLSETGVSTYLKRLLKPASRLFKGIKFPCRQNM